MRNLVLNLSDNEMRDTYGGEGRWIYTRGMWIYVK